MDLKGKLRRGMRMLGADNRDYGTIDRWDDEYVYAGERRYPVSAFERYEGNNLYVGASGRQYFETDTRTGARGVANEGEIRVPVVEEQVNIPVELRREEVTVNRVDVPDRPATAGDMDAFKEGTIRVPVRGEEVVVNKEAVVTGEVVINREQTVERQTVSDTIRKERVDVDENYRRDRAAFQEHFKGRRAGLGTRADTRKFEEAEPNYRMGYEAAYDERFAGHKRFEDVEPELRRHHTGGGSWEELREEIREGWERARR